MLLNSRHPQGRRHCPRSYGPAPCRPEPGKSAPGGGFGAGTEIRRPLPPWRAGDSRPNLDNGRGLSDPLSGFDCELLALRAFVKITFR